MFEKQSIENNFEKSDGFEEEIVMVQSSDSDPLPGDELSEDLNFENELEVINDES